MLIKWPDIERLTHSIKTATACIIGFLLAKVVGLPADQWIVITIIVVMCAQIYVGGVLQKAYLRFLGTLIGCVLAALTIVTFGSTNLAIAAAIGLSSFVFSYYATGQESMGYAGTLGAVTTAIIMLGQQPTVLFAVQRFLEISVGILIATLVSQFFLPIHARTHLRRTQANTLEQLRDYYIACMITHAMDREALRYQNIDDNIVKSLSKQRQLAQDAAREPINQFYDSAHFIQTLHYEKEMLRAIDFMHIALEHIDDEKPSFTQSPAMHSFNDTIVSSLNTLIKVIESNHAPENHVHIPSLQTLKEDIQKNVALPSREELIYIDGFLFSTEILTRCLAQLARLYKVPVFENSSFTSPDA